jgi:two-component system sensor histidine kinase VicK
MGTSDASTGFSHKISRKASSLASSIRTKIVLPYAVLTLAVAVVGTFVVTQLVAGSLEERFVNQLVEAGRVASDSVVRQERDHLETLRAMAFTQGVDAAVASGDMHTLNKLLVPLAVNDQIDSVEVTDEEGRELLGFRHYKVLSDVGDYTLTTGTDLSDWPIVTQILEGQFDELGDKFVMLVEEPSGHLFYTGGPIKQKDRIVGAILVGTYLDEFLVEIKQEALADVTFYDNQGQVLDTTFPGGREQVKDILEVPYASVRSILDRAEESLQSSVSLYGRTYRIVYGPLQIRGELLGIYSVALPSSFIVERKFTSRVLFGSIFFFAMLLVFVMGYLISRRIIRPIIRLVQTSRAVADGDLSQQTGIRSGDEIGILASSFDHMTLSLRERTQQLEEEASKIRAILESIADGVIVEDRESQVILMNPAAERILGSMSEGFPVYPIRELPVLHADPSSAGSLEDRRFEAGGKVVSAREAPVTTRDGVELGRVVVFRDITREVEVDRLKDEFIENVSHELRTPLTSIKGYSELLMLTAGDKLNEQQRKSLDYINERSSQVVTMISELLDMTDIAAGTIGLDQTHAPLDKLIQEVMDSWQERIEEKKLTAIAQLSHGLPQVWADRDRIRRVLHNLISNACNYTMPGGRITVTAYVDGNKVRVDVEDTGYGISEKDQGRLFTRFFRARDVPHDDVRGAGLGLYMAKALIEAHGECIWLERSRLGEGSVFSFTLPIAETQEPEEANSLPIGARNAEAVERYTVPKR